MVARTAEPLTLYACGYGVYKTTDGGDHWAWSGAGLDASCATLAIDGNGTFYAGTTSAGVFRSTDAGATWSPSSNGLGSLFVSDVLGDPSTPGVAYAATTTGVFRSTDSGASWQAASAGLSTLSVRALAAPADAAGALYVGSSGGGVFRSTDSGGTWTPAGLAGQSVGALAVDGTPGTLFAAANGGVYKTTDSGGSWLGPLGAGSALAADPVTPGRIYAASADPGSVYSSTDGGASWQLIGNVPARGLYVSATHSLYAATDRGMARRPSPGSFAYINTGIDNLAISAVAVDPSSDQTVYAGAWEKFQVFKSTDGGSSWTRVTDRPISGLNSLFVNPVNPTVLHALTGTWSVDTSTDAGFTWSTRDLPFIPFTLAFDSQVPQGLYASSDGVYRSTDAGATWGQLATNGVVPWPGDLEIDDSVPPSKFYAGTWAAGVYRSTDGGATWSASNSGLTDLAVRCLVLDRQDLATLYVGTQTSGVFKSTDAGATWVASSNGLTDLDVVSLEIHPDVPSRLYAGTNNAGVFESNDAGASWQPIGAGLPSPRVRALALSAGAPATVYVASGDRGLWQQTFPVPVELQSLTIE